MKVCSLDVYKDSIFCAIFDGKNADVKKFDTFTPDLKAMCDWVRLQGVETEAMEYNGPQNLDYNTPQYLDQRLK